MKTEGDMKRVEKAEKKKKKIIKADLKRERQKE
jgi:hypothetical protein